ncbi:hypothetical protein VNO80_20985 [Phaseolus coccineus]|uniref:Uncharacterized protein n=1 Tax=Phaseolus coccineus TaxID=3886 RepID=A0AAN9M1K5_PHACN
MVGKGTVPENLNQRGVRVIAPPCSKTSALLFITLAHRLENPTTNYMFSDSLHALHCGFCSITFLSLWVQLSWQYNDMGFQWFLM